LLPQGHNTVQYITFLNLLEIDNIITKLTYKKDPGTENIPSVLIKYGGSTLKQRLYDPILLIWKKEELPKDWTGGIICPIYNKGARTECSNYRPITLLNITYKIFAILLNNRLSEIVQGELSDVQMGFRLDRLLLIIL
jgi:hypothetical protein